MKGPISRPTTFDRPFALWLKTPTGLASLRTQLGKNTNSFPLAPPSPHPGGIKRGRGGNMKRPLPNQKRGDPTDLFPRDRPSNFPGFSFRSPFSVPLLPSEFIVPFSPIGSSPSFSLSLSPSSYLAFIANKEPLFLLPPNRKVGRV